MSSKYPLSSDYLKDTSREYSLYVCQNRAIPRVSDGLKDGQRKIMWLIRNKNEKIKVVSLAGEMISSNLYVHGDASASDAISKMGAPYLNNVPLIKGIGAFGTRVAPVEGIGAPRYIYCKKYNASTKLMYPDLDVIPMKENYDGSTMEPVTFLPIIPTVLLNGISGIAVGWATDILPRSLDDIIHATLNALDDKRFKRLSPSYDYLNVDVEHIEGNSWLFSGKGHVENATTVRITELPPDLTLEKFKARLVQMEDEGKIKDWIDRSTRNINIEVMFKRGSLKGWKDEKVISFFKLATRKTERIVVIDWDGNSIKQYKSAEDLIKDFVVWRFQHYIRRYEKLLKDTSYELKYWEAVKLCFDKDLPGSLVALNNKKEIEELVMKITKLLKIDNDQLQRIVGIPTYNWAKDRYAYVLEKIKELKALQTEYTDLLDNPDKIKTIYKNEVAALKKEKF